MPGDEKKPAKGNREKPSGNTPSKKKTVNRKKARKPEAKQEGKAEGKQEGRKQTGKQEVKQTDKKEGKQGRKQEGKQGRKQTNKKQKKARNAVDYEEYVSKKELNEGIENGTIETGILYVSHYPYRSFVQLEGKRDIIIRSASALNRAFHGDRVAVKVVENKERKESKGEEANIDSKLAKLSLSDEESNEEGVEESEASSEEEPQRKGKIVAILDILRPKTLMGVYVNGLFYPTNIRYPRMILDKNTVKPDETLANHFIIVEVPTKWHTKFPQAKCRLSSILGQLDLFDTQYEALKQKNNISHEEIFDDEVLVGLPLSGWSIPDEEIAKRLDLRKELIFSIDPPTARDLDDALSCIALPNGNFKVGVHIADVSYFVTHNSPLDLEARDRATTVYFVKENIPMLPRILCDELCSLQSNVDRLAFTVIWELTPEGKKVSEEFHRSVICTAGQLDYATAHDMIENPTKYTTESENLQQCCTAVNQMNKLAQSLRTDRYANGSLALDNAEIHFDFGEDDKVVGVSPYQRYDSHFLVEEFMLLANTSVAEYLCKSYPKDVLVRKHPPPNPDKIELFKNKCEQLHLEVDCSSSGALHDSIQKIQQEHNGITMDAILCMASEPMQSAQYCPTTDQEGVYHHYALNFPLYCHFTSPIRRYPDLITHRQLGAAIAGEEQAIPSDLLFSIAENCNQRKRDADYASRDCDRLYLNEFLRSKTFIERGIVVGIEKNQLSILVPNYDVKKDINLNAAEFTTQWKSTTNELVLTWKTEEECQAEAASKKKKKKKAKNKKVAADQSSKEEEAAPVKKKEVEKKAKVPRKTLTLKLLHTLDVQLLHTDDNFCRTVDLKVMPPK